jgi:uncharacterized protein (DUF305 family)
VHARSQDPEVEALALDILTTQQAQIGMMGGWLEQWGQTQAASGPTMAWMGHSGAMPGMASQEELASLRTLPAGELEEQFLRLMIRHHAGACRWRRTPRSRGATRRWSGWPAGWCPGSRPRST